MFDQGSMHKAYLGKHANELVVVSSEQVAVIYQQRGLLIPVEVSSALQYLGDQPKASISDMSRDLSLPHQLVAQRVSKLTKLGCVTRQPDPNDGRRTELVLTAKGRRQQKLLIQTMIDTAVVYQALYDEIGCDLPAMLSAAIQALKGRPLSQRFADALDASRVS